MAKFRKRKRSRSKSRGLKSFGRRTGRSISSKVNKGTNLLMNAIPYGLYGFVRTPLVGMSENIPILKDLPVPTLYKDNLTLGTIGLLGAVFGSGVIQKAGVTILNSEALLTAIDVGSNMHPSSDSGSGIYIYG